MFSCLPSTRLIIAKESTFVVQDAGQTTNRGASPTYPLSASILSPA